MSLVCICVVYDDKCGVRALAVQAGVAFPVKTTREKLPNFYRIQLATAPLLSNLAFICSLPWEPGSPNADAGGYHASESLLFNATGDLRLFSQ